MNYEFRMKVETKKIMARTEFTIMDISAENITFAINIRNKWKPLTKT